MKKLLSVFSIVIAIVLGTHSVVFAANEGLFMHQDTVIPAGQTVENVIVTGGNAEIYGHVRDAVIVFNGDLTLGKSAQVGGIVVVIGGKISQETGAQLQEYVLNIAFDNAVKNSLFIAGGSLLGIWFIQIVLSLLLILLPVLTVYVVKHRLHPFVAQIRHSLIQLLMIGFVASLMVSAISILLSITVIGIPFVVLLLLLVLLFFVIGLTAISIRIAEWMPNNSQMDTWLQAFTGALIVMAAVNIPLLGGFVFLCLLWVSLGIMVVWVKEKIQKKG
ncbi:hypothetical protein DFP93_11786 [Aneurinibacillus soli]|uniref:Uncharacterized protein n=1 Tax=Aneurinibacillus soli TaxID=1500254 RepID=A0A0U5AZF3_9BACL|nr:hypothetical protein [Aneurinibacillus soli]PYE59513.1 hypothetical protein DFP93_11786 [Aneurinibacillus soli]BAU29157.1 hypothetical protein CB4_03338 [Aneurinibacillus soli]